jgi:cephalosporin hydroxylase
MFYRILKKIKPTYSSKFSGDLFEVNNWDISSFIIKKIIPIVGTHPFPLNELQLMVSCVAWSKPTHIFEWGTNIGKSARVFYEAVNFLKMETQIHSVDLPNTIDHVEHPGKKRGKLVNGKSNVFLHQGDGVDKSIEILGSLSGEKRPMFYLDGDHSYETVFRELDTILSNVSSPRILLHDTFYQSNNEYNIGPYQAIQDIIAKYHKYSFKIVETNLGLPGMTFLYVD